MGLLTLVAAVVERARLEVVAVVMLSLLELRGGCLRSIFCRGVGGQSVAVWESKRGRECVFLTC